MIRRQLDKDSGGSKKKNKAETCEQNMRLVLLVLVLLKLVSFAGIDEKVIALPSKAIETIMSQPCDSREVVLQLRDSLQLNQDSLEQPNPGTKRLIRCLANKAKQSNRLDVVKHLRDIAPAGTTGEIVPVKYR